MPSNQRPPTIVHIGAFDLASYGDQIFPLVAAHEMGRRLGEVEVLPFGPLGSPAHVAGVGCWALGRWSPERAAALARRATLVLCGGGEIVQGDGTIYAPFYRIDPRDAADLRIDRWFIEVLGAAESTCPVVWHSPGVPADLDCADSDRVRAALAQRAVIAVRDDGSRARLEAAGVDRPVEVVPDSAFLLPRVLPADDLARRRAGMRAAGTFPVDGPVVVVQGNTTMRGLASPLAQALRDLVPEARVATVAVSPCHGDDAFAAELSAALDGHTWRAPGDGSLEDTAAAIAGADCFLGVSLHGAITARAYGRPHVTLDPFGQAKLSGLADLLDGHGSRAVDPVAAVEAVRNRLTEGPAATPSTVGIEALIDAHFDRLAELALRRLEVASVVPPTWADTATPLHLTLRRPPRTVVPAPDTEPANLRRPDITPSFDELSSTVAAALTARMALRDEARREHDELSRLRDENRHLRGAIDHLAGVVRHEHVLEHELEHVVSELRHQLRDAEQERSRLADAVQSARGSRIFRLTGRPSALRNADRLRN